ncbi:hypothetical protein IWQ51_004193 [Labrenzia sp. EL_142]|nr:hypothetical protein [Labrenzia sp. EL_142]
MPCVDTLKAMICCPFVVFGLNPQNDRGSGCFLGRAVSTKQSSKSNSQDISKYELATVYKDNQASVPPGGGTKTKPRGPHCVTSPLLNVPEPDPDIVLLDALIAAGTRNTPPVETNDTSKQPLASHQANPFEVPSRTINPDRVKNEVNLQENEQEYSEETNQFSKYRWSSLNVSQGAVSEKVRKTRVTNKTEIAPPRSAMPSVLNSAKYPKNDADVTKDTENVAPEEGDLESAGDLDI